MTSVANAANFVGLREVYHLPYLKRSDMLCQIWKKEIHSKVLLVVRACALKTSDADTK